MCLTNKQGRGSEEAAEISLRLSMQTNQGMSRFFMSNKAIAHNNEVILLENAGNDTVILVPLEW